MGRFICGFLCPFGWLQDLLHRIPLKKFSTKKVRPLRYIKYFMLFFVVGLMPILFTNVAGMGEPYFCKYVCPQGVLEGGIPLAIANPGIRAALGFLFSWKTAILVAVILLSILFYRPFCKWLCPLGAFIHSLTVCRSSNTMLILINVSIAEMRELAAWMSIFEIIRLIRNASLRRV